MRFCASLRLRCRLVAVFLLLAGLPLHANPQEISVLAAPEVRRALAEEHALITRFPDDPRNYINLAYTLTDAGLGEQARMAAADAVRVAPESALAFSAQAWVLHHNGIGVEYAKGFDYDGSLRALRRSIELDPEDLNTRESLAELLEYDHGGNHYGAQAQLSLAIEARRFVKQHQQQAQQLREESENNLIFALFYAGRYREALAELNQFPASPKRAGLTIASIAATQGSAAAVAFAQQIGGDEQNRKEALTLAAVGLWSMRLYAEAADMMTASLPNSSDQTIAAKIQIFRTLKPYEPVVMPVSDPRRPVQQLLEGSLTGTLGERLLAETLSRNSYASEEEWQAALRVSDATLSRVDVDARQMDLPRPVLVDITFSRSKVLVNASTGATASIMLQRFAATPRFYFVVREGNTYKVAATDVDEETAGAQALYLLAHGQLDTARTLLDWKLNHLGDGDARTDDPLGGNLFKRMWSPGSRTPEAILFAAAALICEPLLLRPIVPKIVAAEQGATDARERTNLKLLLVSVYMRLGDAANTRLVAAQLLQQYPDSLLALQLAGVAEHTDRNWAAWKALLAGPLQRHPLAHDLLIESAQEAIAEDEYSRAREIYKTILHGEEPTPSDYNSYAWLSLFEGGADEDAIAAAQQASLAAKNEHYAYLHTLACLHAQHGDTAEAHQELLDAMSSAHLSEPNAAIWLGFGLLYEQYGVNEAAIAAYRRVFQKDGSALSDGSERDQTSSYVLAQMRLKALHMK